MGDRWINNDTELMFNNLVDGSPVQYIMALFPRRSEGSIRLKAQYFGFGVKTSKVDGITRFYANIKSRVRHANTLPEIDEVNSIVNAIEASQPAQAVISTDIDHSEPTTRIIAYDGFSANAEAVRIITENNLDPDPKFIYQLSKQIIKSKL